MSMSVPKFAGVVATLCMLGVLGCSRQAADSAHAAPAVSADSLIVSVDDVRKVAQAGDLNNVDVHDVHQPKDESDLSDVVTACRPAYSMESLFGTNWKQFRSVGYAGSDNRAVYQSVAVYGSDADARATLDQIQADFDRCSASGSSYAKPVHRESPARLVVSTNGTDTFQTKGPVLVHVRSVHFNDNGKITQAVLHTILDHVQS